MAKRTRKPKGKPERAAFTVDTQVFRELGELLVGRDSTALLELVKNSYDADASIVVVDGDSLSSVRNGRIVVRDDGNGMTLAQFRRGFLRLAGRSKTLGERRSARYGRRFTGEKGVGRLAAHKLAGVLDIESTPWSDSGGRPRGVRAHIDWAQIERRRSMEKAGESISLSSFAPSRTSSGGTELTLSRLRHAWTDREVADFVANAASFAPPEVLLKPKRLRTLLAPAKPLFAKPRERDRKGEGSDPGFRVELTGEFVQGSEYWDELLESVEWVLEIDATPNGITFAMAPTQRERSLYEDARQATYSAEHPNPSSGPFFQARIFVRDRLSGSRIFKNWSRAVAGIRVYSEGFRVLPYGSPDNDWLQINRDYAARRRTLERLEQHEDFLAELMGDEEDDDPNAALTILPVDSYVGAVFLTRERSGDLEMLVNREGFVDNEAFESLYRFVRLGVDLLTRARAAGREHVRAERRAREREPAPQPSSNARGGTPPAVAWRAEVSKRLEKTQTEVTSIRASIAAGDVASAESRLKTLEREVNRLTTAVNALVAEQRLTPVLASLGIQMAEFVHEVNGLLAMATTLDTVLARLRKDPDNFAAPDVRRRAAGAHQTARDLRARLERQASYLIDLTSPTAVRRRSRQRLAERFDRATELVRPVVERRDVRVVNRIPTDLRTPPMYPAEITALLLNLLTNAVKAAGEGGRIVATARLRQKQAIVALRLDNTGQAVELDDAERWFQPFETTTVDVDPLLGQGMGLGLPISRGIVEEYGGSLAFVPPRKSYATAVELQLPAP